jgi:putative Ca2+/H+ antiporter (TMEM165/GDT1 family)
LAARPWRELADRSGPIGETSGVGASGWRASTTLRVSTGPDVFMEPYAISTVLVALAEMGDRTQLLAVMLASRFRKPVPILLGIAAATIANHGLAALVGFYLSTLLSSVWFKYAVSVSFIAMAAWALVPDKADDDDKNGSNRAGVGVFLATAISFFLVEMGDKTQIATAALAARFHDVLIVAAGTTTGMMLANIPAVLLGHNVTRVLPMAALRVAAALVYAGLGVWGVAATAGWVK